MTLDVWVKRVREKTIALGNTVLCGTKARLQ